MVVAIQGKEDIFCYADDTAIISQGTTLEKTYKATEKGLTVDTCSRLAYFKP